MVTLILCSPTSTADELEGLSVTVVDGEYSLQVAVVLNAPVDYVHKVITDYKNAYRINPAMNGTKLSPSDTSAMRQFIESEEEGWLGIG